MGARLLVVLAVLLACGRALNPSVWKKGELMTEQNSRSITQPFNWAVSRDIVILGPINVIHGFFLHSVLTFVLFHPSYFSTCFDNSPEILA